MNRDTILLTVLIKMMGSFWNFETHKTEKTPKDIVIIQGK